MIPGMPDPKQLLSAHFNKYSGRKVLHPMATAICFTSEEIAADAAKLGLTTRFLYPNQMATCDHLPNRLNVHIEQKKDGSHFIKRFDLG